MQFRCLVSKKILFAKATTESIIIEGRTDENSWKNTTEVATNCIVFEPDNGKLISKDKKSEVEILDDNDAVYISAILYDNQPGKIQRQITNRDVFGASDHFSVLINGFNDGQQDFRFYVSAANVQMDSLATEGNEDFTWDAIWESQFL